MEVEAPEAATFYGIGSGKKNIGSGSESDKNLQLPALPLLWYLKQEFFLFLGKYSELKPDFKLCWTSAKWKRKRPYWKRINFKTVEVEAG